MTLRARLALGLLTIALLLAVPLAMAVYSLNQASEAAAQLRDREVSASLVLGRVRAATLEASRAEGFILIAHPEGPDSLMRAAARLTALADSIRDLQLDSLADTIRRSAHVVQTYGRVEAEAVADGDKELADRTSEQLTIPAIATIDRAVVAAEQTVRENARTRTAEASDAAERAYEIAALLFAIAAVVAPVVAVWLTRSISRPVKALERGMAAVAGGNFTHRLELDAHRSDEFGRLATSFQSMAEQLAELEKLRAEFVSVASHELKTPINVILGYLKLLEENLYGPINERQAEVIGTLETQAQSLSRLTQHLLDVSRFQAGAGGLELRPVGLRSFLAQVEQSYGVLARERGITLTVTPAGSLPEAVHWDADRMNEVFANLLSNAFKFTEPGGRVDLTVSPLHDAVYVEVRDTGAGI
jgi:signal transduction histidine kinase